jgi:hypothetical protein
MVQEESSGEGLQALRPKQQAEAASLDERALPTFPPTYLPAYLPTGWGATMYGGEARTLSIPQRCPSTRAVIPSTC